MYDAIYVIVDKGTGEDVLKESSKKGAKGATLTKARGAGVHEQSTLLNMQIEPEKEMVMIIVKKEKTKEIVTHIRDKFDISKPGKGIIFVQNISDIYGLRKD